MKTIMYRILLIFILVTFSFTSSAMPNLSFGAGYGGLWGGYGVTTSLPLDNVNLHFDFGCDDDFDDSSCGFGIGAYTTSLLSNTNKHALGLKVGFIESGPTESDPVNNKSSYSPEALNGVTLNYLYFPNSANKSGIFAGLALIAKEEKAVGTVDLKFTIGYNF